MRNISGKKRARQEHVDSDYLFDNCLARLAFLSNHIDGYPVEVNEASAGAPHF
jgi:hypothetical protein